MTRYLKMTLLLVVLALTACAAGPTRDQTLNDQGYTAMQAGDMEEAERLLKEALDENPNNMQAMVNLAMLYQQTDRPDEARALYLRVIDAEANAEENGQDPEEAARLGKIARDNIAEMDRQEAMRKEAEELAAAKAAPVQQEEMPPPPVQKETGYRIQVGAFAISANAEKMRARIKQRHADLIEGGEVRMVEVDGMTKVQIGPYGTSAVAKRACSNLKQAGIDCFRLKR